MYFIKLLPKRTFGFGNEKYQVLYYSNQQFRQK